jgi:hypothetical protein
VEDTFLQLHRMSFVDSYCAAPCKQRATGLGFLMKEKS